jgi:hypothetical protein
MRTLFKNGRFPLGLWVLAIVMFAACETEDANMDFFTNTVMVSNAEATANPSYCGETSSVTLIAGQHIAIGSVTIGNDADYLYVTFSTEGDWYMTETHLLVGSVAGIKNPAPGQFPYQANHDPAVQSYTYQISLEGLGESFNVAAHAAVVRVSEDGEVVQGETAWGEGPRFNNRGNWAMYTSYTVQECDDDDDNEGVCQTETAWADGFRYVAQGNWATYTPYDGSANTVTLFAGQTINIGTVSFSAVSGGMVTISIEFAGSWTTQDVAEAVKIQGYDEAPSGNPAIGNFEHKGNALSVTVPTANYFGVHVDAARLCN